jgi:hypothetical protein
MSLYSGSSLPAGKSAYLGQVFNNSNGSTERPLQSFSAQDRWKEPYSVGYPVVERTQERTVHLDPVLCAVEAVQKNQPIKQGPPTPCRAATQILRRDARLDPATASPRSFKKHSTSVTRTVQPDGDEVYTFTKGDGLEQQCLAVVVCTFVISLGCIQFALVRAAHTSHGVKSKSKDTQHGQPTNGESSLSSLGGSGPAESSEVEDSPPTLATSSFGVQGGREIPHRMADPFHKFDPNKYPECARICNASVRELYRTDVSAVA